MVRYKNPLPTVDVIIEMALPEGRHGIVLIERKNPPFGWALPGGFVNYGESLEEAAVREAKEETCLDIELLRQLHTYSDPGRDPRKHTLSTVYIARAVGEPQAKDDAWAVGVFTREEIRFPLAFDHRTILDDYFAAGKESSMAENKKKPSPPEQDMALKEIHSVWGPAEAAVIKSFLESHGINCLCKGSILQSVYPFSMDGLGQVKIFVLEEDYEAAKALLEQMPKPCNIEEFTKDEEDDAS